MSSLPGVEPTGKIGDFAEAGATQDAGGNGAAIAAFAVDDEELVGVEFAGAVGQLTKRDTDGVFYGSGFNLARFADVKDGKMVLFFFLKLG